MASLLKPWIVRYLDADGKQVRKGTPGARKVRERSSKWYGQFTDADGRRRRVPLCTDKVSARQMLATLEREILRGKTGLIDPYAKHLKAPIKDHVSDYETHQRNKGVTRRTLKEDLRRLRAVIDGCGFRTLGEMRPEAVELFLSGLAEGKRKTGPVTRNTYLKSIKAFASWCLRTHRMGQNLLACLRAVKPEVRRQRRALTEDELARLLKATRERPMVAAMTIKRGPRKGKPEAVIRDKTRAKIERIGLEHSLIYKTLTLTGLRRGELEALEVRHLDLSGKRPCLILPPAETKNRKGANLPLRADLAADLKRWIKQTGKRGTDRVFHVSPSLNTLLKRDLKYAGIPYKDEKGRTIDVHSLRHTTASHMGKGKVSPRIAQRFMRHADVRMTLQVYTDADLMDEAEALAALPTMKLPEG